MVNRAIRLSDAIEEFLASSSSRGDKPNTIRSKRSSLDRLLNDKRTGNILMKNIGPDHVDSVFESMHQQGLAAASVNLHRAHLALFFKWCQSRRYVTSTISPMDGTRPLKEVPRKRVIVPVGKFAHLLNCATHPRDRAIIALGLYLFLRQSEVRALRVGDVDLDSGWLDVKVLKTSQRDRMPISEELDDELRSWLTYYSNTCGGLDPAWCLIPARSRPVMGTTPGVSGFTRRLDGDGKLLPMRPLKQIETPVKKILVRAGFQVHDEDGKSNFEGLHTLRRSGARARFDALVEAGHDGAIREVQAMLHHASTRMTEHYLGLTLDIDRRDKNIRGKPMFPAVTDGKIATLPQRRAAQ